MIPGGASYNPSPAPGPHGLSLFPSDRVLAEIFDAPIILPSDQFAAQSHEVLSTGYRVDVQFGIDYRNQADITTTTRDTFEAEVERRWRATSWASSLIDVSVEFMAAGRSSLDYFVRVDLDGSQATDYAAQRRHLTSICVDVCNENGWVIPLAQMTVHLAPPREE